MRYSTTGSNAWENAQPVHRSQGADGSGRELALGHNGNLINAIELHDRLAAAGVPFSSTSDSEIIAALIATHDSADGSRTRSPTAMPQMHGAYSAVAMTREKVVAFRDPLGLRPLVARPPVGVPAARTAGAWRASRARSTSSAPNSCATSSPARSSRSAPTVSRPGWSSRASGAAFCVFEYIYFARPDSRMNGQVLQVVRGRMGEILWREAPVDADVVIAVPDSGNAAARGLARASGLPQDDGFIKNRYVARTFIQPGQELRRHGLRLKFNPLPEVVRGKRLVVVDDSIVRGNTTRQIVAMLREAGAAEIHLRISRAADQAPLLLRDRHVDARAR